MAQITYADKSAMNTNSSIPDTNKCNASDMNEIKTVVNGNYTEMTSELDKRSNFIVAGLSANQTNIASGSVVLLNLNSVGDSYGSLLTLNTTNKEIVIGAGVNHVEISGQIYIYSRTGNGVRNIYIYKNSTIMTRANIYMDQDYQTITAGTKIIPVSQGDKLTLRVNTSGGVASVSNEIARTFLSVRVID